MNFNKKLEIIKSLFAEDENTETSTGEKVEVDGVFYQFSGFEVDSLVQIVNTDEEGVETLTDIDGDLTLVVEEKEYKIVDSKISEVNDVDSEDNESDEDVTTESEGEMGVELSSWIDFNIAGSWFVKDPEGGETELIVEAKMSEGEEPYEYFVIVEAKKVGGSEDTGSEADADTETTNEEMSMLKKEIKKQENIIKEMFSAMEELKDTPAVEKFKDSVVEDEKITGVRRYISGK